MAVFEYNICNQADKSIFEKQCAALERHIPDLNKEKRLIDVDGSQTQLYSLDGKRISVHNSNYIDAVYVESEIELESYFK